MKKLFLFILFIVQVAFVSAVDNEVSMVSYEQNWIDDQGTIALKNNTDNEVMSVSFMITYLDMNGNQLDYKEFKKPVNIKPGLTKKINIEAYEHSRYYSYYKSEAAFSNPKKFDVKYKLLSVNFYNKVENGQTTRSKKNNLVEQKTSAITKEITDKESTERLVITEGFEKGISEQEETERKEGNYIYMFVLMFALTAYLGLFALIAAMANNRNRSAIGWVVFALFFNPIITIIILSIIGESSSDKERY